MNKGILFFIGLLVGILFCVLLFYFDIKFFEARCPACDKKEVVIQTLTDTVYVEVASKQKKQNFENNLQETVLEEIVENIEIEQFENDDTIYEPAFTLEEEDLNEIFADQLLQTKTVKVKVLSQGKKEVKLPENFFQFFEIQQWSTLIKNKITYHRDKNLVKIKGMDIENVNVVFLNSTYYLEIGDRYYAIPETLLFEKLNLIQLTY